MVKIKTEITFRPFNTLFHGKYFELQFIQTIKQSKTKIVCKQKIATTCCYSFFLESRSQMAKLLPNQQFWHSAYCMIMMICQYQIELEQSRVQLSNCHEINSKCKHKFFSGKQKTDFETEFRFLKWLLMSFFCFRIFRNEMRDLVVVIFKQNTVFLFIQRLNGN